MSLVFRVRQTEMTLIAQHKYGVRVTGDTKWKAFLDHLGESAVVFELLQTKPSSAVKIDFGCSSSGSSKGNKYLTNLTMDFYAHINNVNNSNGRVVH